LQIASAYVVFELHTLLFVLSMGGILLQRIVLIFPLLHQTDLSMFLLCYYAYVYFWVIISVTCGLVIQFTHGISYICACFHVRINDDGDDDDDDDDNDDDNNSITTYKR